MNKIKQITPHNLMNRLVEQSQYALKTGSLITLPTDYEIHHDQGVDFVIRILGNLQRKVDSDKKRIKKQNEEKFNPFLPYDTDMYVGHISDKHVCLLNKFNIVDHHFLIVTSSYYSQDELLDKNDFEALHSCLLQIDGLGFFNGGKVAGASQHHKHLQVIPLPLAPHGSSSLRYKLPIEKQLYNHNSEQNLFNHSIHYFEQDSFNQLDGPQLFSIYKNLMVRISKWPSDGSIKPTGSYNLLCTRNWMLLIPRTQECVRNISVNSLGFSGGLLVKNNEELDQLIKTGPMQILVNVSS